jgi:SAM-dependent methyltransferase
MKKFYDYPEYYQLAFSFRDIKHEVDIFEECFRRFSKIPVGEVLELACGPSPHLEELARRGYKYTGLDNSQKMLDYARNKARTLRIPASFILADMLNFTMETKADFAYLLLGSLFVKSTKDILSHFAGVAEALKPGGLYLLDWCIDFLLGALPKEENWTEEKEGVKIDIRFIDEGVVERTAQLSKYRIDAEVIDQGEHIHLGNEVIVRRIFPQEFLLLVEKTKKFEFVGWWNNWDLAQPIDQAERIARPITLVRRI